MSFPLSPTNGQQASINGITYTYSSTLTAWTVSTSVSNSFVSISVTGTVNSGNLLATGLASVTGNITVGNVVTVGIVTATGNVSGNYFIGNGSALTGISAGGSAITNGTSNVTVASGANTTVGVAGTTVATFASTGLILPGIVSATGNISAGNLNVSGNIVDTGALSIITGSNGNITLSPNGTGQVISSGSVSVTGTIAASGAVLPRVVSIADGVSITMNGDTTDIATQTNTQAAGTLTINAVTGTLFNGQKIILRLQSANIQTFSWNAVFVGSTDLILPTASTGSNKYDYVGFIYNTTATKWQLLAKNFGF